MSEFVEYRPRTPQETAPITGLRIEDVVSSDRDAISAARDGLSG